MPTSIVGALGWVDVAKVFGAVTGGGLSAVLIGRNLADWQSSRRVRRRTETTEERDSFTAEREAGRRKTDQLLAGYTAFIREMRTENQHVRAALTACEERSDRQDEQIDNLQAEVRALRHSMTKFHGEP